MPRGFTPTLRVVAASFGLLALFAGSAAGAPHQRDTIDGSINPASSDYLQGAIQQSESDGAEALLIELDTPGGLLSSTKDIIQAMLNAEVPVVVFVSPKGAWAASAGTFITLAGHIAAMAPGTSIGSGVADQRVGWGRFARGGRRALRRVDGEGREDDHGVHGVDRQRTKTQCRVGAECGSRSRGDRAGRGAETRGDRPGSGRSGRPPGADQRDGDRSGRRASHPRSRRRGSSRSSR